MKKSHRTLFIILVAIFLVAMCTIAVYIAFFGRGQSRPLDGDGTSTGTNDTGRIEIPSLDQEPQGSHGISREEVRKFDNFSVKAVGKIYNSGAFAEISFADIDKITAKIEIHIFYEYYIYVGGKYLIQRGQKTVEAQDAKQLTVEINPLIDDAENPLSVYFHSMHSAKYFFFVKDDRGGSIIYFSPDFELVNEE